MAKFQPASIRGIVALAALVLSAGCVPAERTPHRDAGASAGTAPADTVAVAPAAKSQPEPAVATKPAPSSAAAPAIAVTTPSAAAPASVPAPAPVPETKAAAAPAPAAKATPAPAASVPVPAPQAAKEASPAPVARTPEAPPPLDLATLETRLKETKGIGIMTKLALKNQVDDLLDQFRDFYRGRLKTTLADLHKSFDLLVLKVLSLLQDSDPSLAHAVAASRDAIWSILADPAKFAKFAAL